MEIATFELVGGLAGKTINLGGHQFVDGVFTFGPSVDQVLPSTDEVIMKGHYLAKSFQAFRVGSPELAAAKSRMKGGKAPEGELVVQEREEQEQAEASDKVISDRARKGAIRSALTSLDAKNDEHWTGAGLPSIEAVRELSALKDVSRQDVNSLAPKLTREEAVKLASDPLD